MSRTPIDTPRWLGPLFMVIGLAIAAVAVGLIPAPPESFKAPRWVLGLCGLIFFAGGFRVQTLHRPDISRWSLLVLVGCFAAVGLWVGLYGEAAEFGGGSEMLSPEDNVSVARWIFAGAGTGCAILFAYMVYNFKTLH